MNTDKIAFQMFECVMEGIDSPYNQREYVVKEKIEIINKLIAELQSEVARIKLYD